jgi:hypothetical protein
VAGLAARLLAWGSRPTPLDESRTLRVRTACRFFTVLVRLARQKALRWAGSADVEASDETVLYPEHMANYPVGQLVPVEIVYGLVNFDLSNASTACREAGRLDMRVDGCPLSSPVLANAVAAVDMTPLHSVRPNDMRVHGRQKRFQIASTDFAPRVYRQRHEYIVNATSISQDRKPTIVVRLLTTAAVRRRLARGSRFVGGRIHAGGTGSAGDATTCPEIWESLHGQLTRPTS